MMSLSRIGLVVLALALVFVVTTEAVMSQTAPPRDPRGGGGDWRSEDRFFTQLEGFQEVPPIFTAARGSFRVRVTGSDSLTYVLRYRNLTSPAVAAHIHFGQPGVNGGIVVFLCAGDKPDCPPGNTSTRVEVTGTITGANVRALAAQNFPAGNLAALIRIMQSNVAYANVHSQNFPAGEIRGQISERSWGNDDD